MLQQENGMTNGSHFGLQDLRLTSADHAARERESARHTGSSTQQLEAKSIPPELSNTLEHIVGQLDVLTQVTSYSCPLYMLAQWEKCNE